jgi:hypothetical protein
VKAEVQVIQVGPAVLCPTRRILLSVSLDIKAGSPFKFTFRLSYNGIIGYVPLQALT